MTEVSKGVKNIFGVYKKLPEFEINLKSLNDHDINKKELTRFIGEKIDEILSFFGDLKFEKEFKLEEETIYVKFKGEDLKFLIENDGKILNSLQYIIVLAVNNQFKRYFRIILDYEDFIDKRNEHLKKLTEKLTKKVLEKHCSVTLEPMNPFERRLIHSLVSEIEGVYSKSIGKDPKRSVVIYPQTKV